MRHSLEPIMTIKQSPYEIKIQFISATRYHKEENRMLKLKFENLGTVKTGEIELAEKLTILCGENNMGKTYISYSIYGLLHNVFDLSPDFMKTHLHDIREKGICRFDLKQFLEEDFDKVIQEIEDTYSKVLPVIFSTGKDFFAESNINLTFDKNLVFQNIKQRKTDKDFILGKHKALNIEKQKDSYSVVITLFEKQSPDRWLEESVCKAILKIIFHDLFTDVFLIPSERAGINLFFRELNVNRNILVDHISGNRPNISERMREVISRYPQPVSEYIYFMNDLSFLIRQQSEYKDIARAVKEKIIRGSYNVEDKGISFFPFEKRGKELDLHIASSVAKTFFSLVFYLEHVAKKGDYLIIDEPELNLHPDNQRNIARILAQIANRGIRVIISTHSDYILREINNLMMLNSDFRSRDELRRKYGYSDDELLDINEVSAYMFDQHAINPMEINQEEGIVAETFDTVIHALNESSDDIYYARQEDMNDE